MVSCIGLGWSTQEHVNLAVPIIFFFIIGGGSTLLMTGESLQKRGR